MDFACQEGVDHVEDERQQFVYHEWFGFAKQLNLILKLLDNKNNFRSIKGTWFDLIDTAERIKHFIIHIISSTRIKK